MKHGGYGWRPDKPDHRDQYFESPAGTVLQESVDLRPHCPAVYDQGQLGSCTAQAIAGAIEFDLLKQGGTAFTPSRLFIYYNERVIENSVDWDAGAEIRDGIKSVHKRGVCPEEDWPYVIEEFARKPTGESYHDALLHKTVRYHRLTHLLRRMKTCLASGFPFVFGFSVYESFETDQVASTGVVDLPGQDESMIGGHAVMAVGYDDASQRFIVRNSWGTGWGMDGYFTMPYAYLIDSNLADDFWTIRLVR